MHCIQRPGLAHAHGGIIIRICLIKITSDMTSFADITSPLLSFICSPFSLTLPVTSSTLDSLLLSLTCSLPRLICLSLALCKLHSSLLSLVLLLSHTFQATLNTLTIVKRKKKLTPRPCHVLMSQSDFRLHNVWLPFYAPMHAVGRLGLIIWALVLAITQYAVAL